MSRIKSPVFNEKHLKALELLEKGGLSTESIAKECGWTAKYLYRLKEGDTAQAGSVASLFMEEVKKINHKKAAKLKELVGANRVKGNEQIHRFIEEIENTKNPSIQEKKLLATLMNCISKSSPGVEIGNVSYSYTQGYTPEQLVYEFRRLQTLAGSASNRSAISGTSEGGSGEMSDSLGNGSEVAEEQ